ncbi:hypothetical protein H4I96_12300 [Botrytis cinerea]
MPFNSQIQSRSFYLETYPDGPTPPKSNFSTYSCYIGLGADTYSFIDDLTATFLSTIDFKPECVNFKAIDGKEQLQKIIQEFRAYIQLHHPQGIINFNNIESINQHWVNSALGALIRRNGGKTKRRLMRNKPNLAAIDPKPLPSSQSGPGNPVHHFKAASVPLALKDSTICVHVPNKPFLIHRDVLSTYRTPASQGKLDTTLDIQDISLSALLSVLQNPEECAINFDPTTQSLYHINTPNPAQNLESIDGIEIQFQGGFRFVIQKSLSNGQTDIHFAHSKNSVAPETIAPQKTSAPSKPPISPETSTPHKDAIPNLLPNLLAHKAQRNHTSETDVREHAEDQSPLTNSPRALDARPSSQLLDGSKLPPRKRARLSKSSSPNVEYKENDDEDNIDDAGKNETSPGNNQLSTTGGNRDDVDSRPIAGTLFDYNMALALELEKDVGAPPVIGEEETEDQFMERERDYQERVRNQRTLKMQRQLESKVCEQLSEETWLETCRVLRHDPLKGTRNLSFPFAACLASYCHVKLTRIAGSKNSHPLEDVYESMVCKGQDASRPRLSNSRYICLTTAQSYNSYIHDFFSKTKKQEYKLSSLWKDECHKEKGSDSPTIKLIKSNKHLNISSVHLNPMSGTMITNGPNDIVEYLNLMHVDEWKYDESLLSFDVGKLRSLGKEWESKLKSNKVEESSDIFKKVITSVQPIIEATTLRFTPDTNFLGTGPVVILPPNYHTNIACQHPSEWKETMKLYNQSLDREYNARAQKHRQAWMNKRHGRMDGYQPLSRQNVWLYYMSRQYSNFPALKTLHLLNESDTPYRLTEKEWQEHPDWKKEDDSRNAHNLNFRDEPDLPLSKSTEPYRRHLDVIVKSSNKLKEIRKKIDEFPNKSQGTRRFTWVLAWDGNGDGNGDGKGKDSIEPHIPRYMVAQCSAFAVGLTLNEAYAVGLLEPSYDAAQELQAFSRHSRMGNKEKRTETWLFYNTDDEKELALIERKSRRDSMRAGLDPTHKQKLQLRGGEPGSAIHLD